MTTITFMPRFDDWCTSYAFEVNGRWHTTPTCGAGVVDPGHEFRYFLPRLIDLLGVETDVRVRHYNNGVFTLETKASEAHIEANLKTAAAGCQYRIEDLHILDDNGFLDPARVDQLADEYNLNDCCPTDQGSIIWQDDYGRPYRPTVYDKADVILAVLEAIEEDEAYEDI